MRHFTIATLALTAAALTTTIANAAGFAGNVSVAGPTRNVVVMNQATPLASILATPVRVYMCTGVVEMPVFVATSAVSAQAVGITYVIEATLVDPTTTPERPPPASARSTLVEVHSASRLIARTRIPAVLVPPPDVMLPTWLEQALGSRPRFGARQSKSVR